MALQFQPPPDWLIQEYMNRKSPGQEILDAGLQIAKTYADSKRLNQASKIASDKNAIDKATADREARKQFYEFGDVASLPQDQQNAVLNPAQGPVTESGKGPESPIIAHFQSFLSQNPSGIKGREKQVSNRPQQAPFLINNKPAVFNPGTSQYEIAQVVDPSAQQTLEDPSFTPRVEQPVNSQFVGMQGEKPILLNPRTGQMTEGTLPGGGPLTSTNQTEGQANAKLYAQRMEEADKQLNELDKSVDLSSIGSGIEGKLPNIAKSGNIQMFEQSKRNFLNAVLRRESGAVISPTEFAEGNKQYFTVMGDTPKVKQQKALNRQTAIAGIRNAGGMSSALKGSSGGWSYGGRLP